MNDFLEKIFSYSIEHEDVIVKKMLKANNFNLKQKQEIARNGHELVKIIRENKSFSIERFLNVYNLSTKEGVAVLGLAEALVRIPDDYIKLLLVKDKLSGKEWGDFIKFSFESPKMFMATNGLFLSGKYTNFLDAQNNIIKLINKSGQNLFVKIVRAAIIYLSKEFVFAENIGDAIAKVSKYEEYKFSFDLLGESARTLKQADKYFKSYEEAVKLIKIAFPSKDGENLKDRPNISIKLSSLYPRFELAKIDDIKNILIPKITKLLLKASKAKITICFDAEEFYRLDSYLLFVDELLSLEAFKGYDGIGFVVQAYHLRAEKIIDYIISKAKENNSRLPVRLVKGAYWDTEIKHAQEKGLEYYPVYTKKIYTDLSYITCAKKMLENEKFIYSQFATHNALTVAEIIELAGDKEFEFQKLYGMGSAIHTENVKSYQVRQYAPVGNTIDLLPYLMRRMLENGASANFVNKVNEKNVKLGKLVYDTNDKALAMLDVANKIALPENIYNDRKCGIGVEMGFKKDYDYLKDKISNYYDNVHQVGSIIGGKEIILDKKAIEKFCPAKTAEKFSSVSNLVEGEIKDAISLASKEFSNWSNKPTKERAQIIREIADALEENKFELYALLIKEAGKTIQDAIDEVIEAIDFCRYYANRVTTIMAEQKMPGITGEDNMLSLHGRGVFFCISPWNFPAAIFTGQIIAALATGNTVIAKPADQTTVIANFIVKLMHKAGLPHNALQLVLTSGVNASKYIVSDNRISGIAFTGSCATANNINKTLAEREDVLVPLIAETGGQNAMLVDSSALLEQVTDDILMSAFYSAGQRCSALRMLYVQEEIYDDLLEMLKGAVELIKIGDNSDFTNDIGPVIDESAYKMLNDHIQDMQKKGFKVHNHPQDGSLNNGHYFYPKIIEVNSINDIEDEKFGPILHITKYKSKKIDKVIDEVNSTGFGLTFGIHSRIEDRIEHFRKNIRVGNIYVNRTIIGAKVESQPFGGQNKSGTGFKAGGPNYLLRFTTERTTSINSTAFGGDVKLLRSQ